MLKRHVDLPRPQQLTKRGPRTSNGYLFDFFISYKRDAETRCWIEKHFRPLLTLRVRQEIGSRAQESLLMIRLEAGASWPVRLGENLGRSRVFNCALEARIIFRVTGACWKCRTC